jgi:NADPH-dependent 2,4-dienoyl-CoA reductase/sulfur reductase-like enzyme
MCGTLPARRFAFRANQSVYPGGIKELSMARYVIIGMGVAGVAAAQAIRSRDPAARISLVSAEPDGYYSRPGLAYYLTGEINQAQLYPFQEKEFDQMGVQRLQRKVIRIDPQAHRVEFDDGAGLAYDRLLIATGAKAAPLRVTGSPVQGVVKLDCLEDARQIIRLARRARSAVVVGGGITALELVEGLRARGVKTHYFLRGERYWSNVLDETESRTVEQRLQHEKVHLHYHRIWRNSAVTRPSGWGTHNRWPTHPVRYGGLRNRSPGA